MILFLLLSAAWMVLYTLVHDAFFGKVGPA